VFVLPAESVCVGKTKTIVRHPICITFDETKFRVSRMNYVFLPVSD
jgi:hypothetical protein